MVPAAAPAHGTLATGAGDRVPRAVEQVLGGHVRLLPDGLYRVRSSVGTFTTHGPDFRREIQPIGGVGSRFGPGDPERPPACANDPATDNYQEVLYGYPATGTNDLAAVKASIQAQIRRNNALLNQESLASGGPVADFWVRCDAGGAIKVSAFPVTPDLGETAASFNRIVAAADAAGYDNPNVDYTMFYDGDGDFGACGVAFLWGDDSLTADNANNNPPGFAAGYAVSFAGCWYGLASMHENGHDEGAVQAAAPNSTGSGGHCNEAVDVMCYLDGGDINQDYPQPCASPDPAPTDIHFDCGFNT